MRDQAMIRMGMRPEDLQKLSKVPLIVAVLGLVINIMLLAAMSNFAWLKATALADGQPFTAYLSLTAVQFGTPLSPTADTQYFNCGEGKRECGLGFLCNQEPACSGPGCNFPNGLPKDTPNEPWCLAARAGTTTLSLLWLGFIPGLAATGFSALYASKEIELVGRIVAQVEALGFTDRIQKIIISGCWGILWVFMFFSMTMYASMIPDTLGWGIVELEASFGMLRFCFVVTSIAATALISSFFSLWNAENIVEAYMEFAEARLFSAKKALYIELMLQLILYLFLVIAEVDWSGLLIILAGFYLDAKNKNFLLMYLVGVTISLLFDVIHAAELPSFANMTPGESFGATVWMLIFLMKPLILTTIFFYEKYEKEGEGAQGNAWSRFDDVGMRDDEIAE
jgi:hypothetical protein